MANRSRAYGPQPQPDQVVGSGLLPEYHRPLHCPWRWRRLVFRTLALCVGTRDLGVGLVEPWHDLIAPAPRWCRHPVVRQPMPPRWRHLGCEA